ncbi:hypothetical protein O181_068649 [Austropuccinia psidii MF-1]|uniref:Uncharacterized protein n=1 Tax=Austropuccinia psidii MF-1 TaxID=1389203 RepID=A0A9Q3EXQ1_9BASI|nr:hypothetical protein [Austropuccinia psidii MF-1]
MSSSNPHKSCSGSVHYLNGVYSIYYVQKELPMSPNISLTPPIASSINVSGLNIDFGNTTAKPSFTWTIPNISVTPILLDATNMQMHVSEGPGSTPEISLKANQKSKFACDFLFNPGWNHVESQEPFEKSKQPSLNIPSGSQVHVGHGKEVDFGG